MEWSKTKVKNGWNGAKTKENNAWNAVKKVVKKRENGKKIMQKLAARVQQAKQAKQGKSETSETSGNKRNKYRESTKVKPDALDPLQNKKL